MAGSRMDDHSLRLIHREDVIVLIEDFKGDRLWLEGGLGESLKTDLNFISFFRANSFFYQIPIQENAPLFNEMLKIGP